jgi:secreted protein with Ig-like and vWFA domain
MSDDRNTLGSRSTPRADAPPEAVSFVGWPRWRRPVLLLSGASLLAIGAFANRPAEVVAISGDDGVVEEPVLQAAVTPMEPSEVADQGGDDEESGHVHRGEEGTMGKGGMQAQSSGHFLASPHGGATVGKDDEDVWGGLTGTEVGEAYGVGSLGIIGVGRGGGGVGSGSVGLRSGSGQGYGRSRHQVLDASGEQRGQVHENRWTLTAEDTKSTFSIDVDTASYSSARRFLREGQRPPAETVRIEEFLNYFSYDYPPPEGDVPFSVTSEVGPCPWNPEHRLVHVGLQGKVIASDALPPRNLVFLVDVSGSMRTADRLPLVKRSLTDLVEHLSKADRVAIVVYAGAAGVVLPPTSGADKETILEAIGRLEAGGSTNGGAGIRRAYALARASFVDGGINRVVLASDGDFNVGVTSRARLVELIERERESGVYLSVLGYGMGNYQDATMEQLADKGNGNYAYIDSLAEARKVLIEEAGATFVTIAKDVKLQIELDPATVERFRLVGYENRVLAHRDFADDRKDAGEIGAGHTVTALYEVVPRAAAESDRLMDIGIRYKPPESAKSRALSFSVRDARPALVATSDDFRWSAAVAAFGMLLRDSAHKGAADWAGTRALALEALGTDPMCRRHEMVQLVSTAASLWGSPLPAVDLECTPGERPPTRPAKPSGDGPSTVEAEVTTRAATPEDPSTEAAVEDADRFWLGVLRLLPPLLAFPLFVLAWRDPYRRQSGR